MFQDWSGALSTAGGVAFYGTLDGWFRAVDLSDGKILYQFHCPSEASSTSAVLTGVGGWAIPVSENHLRKTLCAWLAHYNRGRPHSSLGPGLPDPPLNHSVQLQRQRHRFDRSSRLVAHPVLNGLHHEYSFLDRAA
jgi:hypothetical protein